MDSTYQAALQWLISERMITDMKDYECAANAIVVASKKFPMYYREYPTNEAEHLQKEIFQTEVTATYMQGKVVLHALSIYEQDVVRKLMQLRRLEHQK